MSLTGYSRGRERSITLKQSVSVFRANIDCGVPKMKYWIFILLSSVTVDQPRVPTLLQRVLRELPGLRLLDPSVDLVGVYTVEELKEFGHWPPWVVADLDRDGRPDVRRAEARRTWRH